MADVFISYSRRDEDFVVRLAAALEERGKDVWRDREDIGPATAWRDEIHAGIDASDVFAFVLSPESLASRPCADELARAGQDHKTIVPVLRRDPDGTPVPDELSRLNYIHAAESDDFGQAVDRLLAAIDGIPEWERRHTRLLTRAADWDARGRDRSWLLRGSDLQEAEAWSAERPEGRQPTPLQLAYLLASRRGATRRLRGVVATALAALAVTAGLAIAALVQRNTADQRRREAVRQTHLATSRSLAAEANDLADRRLDQAALVALEANAQAPTAEARSAIVTVLERADRVEAIVPGAYVTIASSPNGRWLAALTGGGQIRVFDVTRGGRPVGRQVRTRLSLIGGLDLAVSPGGRTVAIGDGSTMETWNVADGRPGSSYSLGTDIKGFSVDYAPDGRTIVTGNIVAIALWPAARQVRARWQRKVPGGGLDQVVFSPDGEEVTGGDENGLQTWRARDGQTLSTIRLGKWGVDSVAYAPEGDVLAWAIEHRLDERPPRVVLASWSTSGPGRRRVVPTRGLVHGLAFADEHTLIVLGGTRTQTLDLSPGPLRLRALSAYAGAVQALAPAGSRGFATLGTDGSVRLWNLDRPAAIRTVVSTGQPVVNVAISPDGRRVAALDRTGVVQVLDARSGRPAGAAIPSAGTGFSSLGFAGNGAIVTGSNDSLSPRGGVLGFNQVGAGRGPPRYDLGPVSQLTTSADGRAAAIRVFGVALWDAHGRRLGTMPLASGDGAAALAFTSDGRSLAIATTRTNGPSMLRLSSVRTRQPEGTAFAGAGLGDVRVLAFSRNDRLLATGGRRDVQLWSVRGRRATGGPLHVGGTVNGLSFSRDGRTLAVATTTGVSLWDVARRRRLGDRLTSEPTSAIAFGSDGASLVSGDRNGISFWNPIVWTGDPKALRARLCPLAQQPLTRAEWQALLPGLPYGAIC